MKKISVRGVLFLMLILWFLIALALLRPEIEKVRKDCEAVAAAKGYDGEIQIYNYGCRVEYNGEFIDLGSAEDLTP
jgi:hypothetical protein